MKHTYMAIGAHIGDCELQNGLTLSTLSLKGHNIIIVALTRGERGNPKNMSVKEYALKKEKEAQSFADIINAKSIVLDYEDGKIPDNEEIRIEIAKLIRKYKPKAVFTHWKNSMHKDHSLTSKIVTDAQLLSSIDLGDEIKEERHFAPIYFSENWEDEEGFKPYIYFKGTKEAFDLWTKAMKTHWFIMNSTSFKYYDYYTHLAYVRGALARTTFAESYAVFEYQKKVVRDEF